MSAGFVGRSMADSSKRACHKIPGGHDVNWLFCRSSVLGHELAEYRPPDVFGEEFTRPIDRVVGLKIDTAIPGLKVEDVTEPGLRKRDDVLFPTWPPANERCPPWTGVDAFHREKL